MSDTASVSGLVLRGKFKLIASEVQNALDAGISAGDILNAMISAMDELGEKFKNNEVYVPEVLIAARTMKAGVEVLKPCLGVDGTGAVGKVIIGTVSGDLHDIGKNLVAMMMESAGLQVVDLGVDVSAEKFLEAFRQNPDTGIVALSALLTTTMPAMEEIVGRLKAEGVGEKAKIMVGGAPITKEFARKIGADAYTPDAASAAQKAKELVG